MTAKFGVPPERDRRLPGAGRRRGRQRPRRRQGRPEDGGEVARRVRLARRRDRRAPTIKGAVGENLRTALDWLPQGRALVTVSTDCDLDGPRPGLAGARRAGAARRSTRGAAAPSTALRLQGAGARSSRSARHRRARAGRACAAPKPAAAPRPSGRRRRARSPAPSQIAEATTRRSSTCDAARRLAGAARGRASWPRSTPRPIRSTRCAREIVGLSFAVEPGRGGLHPAGARLCRRARPAAARRGAGAPASPGSRTRRRPSSASTSSTTATCSPTTASTVRGYAHDTHAAKLRARGAQAARPGQPGRAAPRPHAASTTRTSAGKGANQIPFAQVDDRAAPPSTRARTPT